MGSIAVTYARFLAIAMLACVCIESAPTVSVPEKELNAGPMAQQQQFLEDPFVPEEEMTADETSTAKQAATEAATSVHDFILEEKDEEAVHVAALKEQQGDLESMNNAMASVDTADNKMPPVKFSDHNRKSHKRESWYHQLAGIITRRSPNGISATGFAFIVMALLTCVTAVMCAVQVDRAGIVPERSNKK
jgi:hypothetical protein